MILMPLMLAGAMAFGHGPAVDQRPFNASRSNAILEASRDEGAQPTAAPATEVRYPSADGDILAGLGRSMTLSPLPPRAPIAAVFPPATAASAEPYGADTSGLLGGPRP